MAKPPPPTPGQLELVRPPAPGNLELVRNFLNTLDTENGTDALCSPATSAAWLREQHLVELPGVNEAELERMRRIRDELRALTRRNNGSEGECGTATLEAASERSRYVIVLDPATNTAQLRPAAPGVDGAIGHILAAVHAAMLAGTWSRLKCCADESCAWTYFDHSKNGCSRWCSAETCGNRSKVKRYRERRAAGGP